MKVRKILTMALVTALTFGMTSNILVPNMVYAKESTENVWTEDASNEVFDDSRTVGTAETADITTFSLDESQMTEEQQSKYEQVLSGERYELGVGESVVIGSSAEGEIYITCVSTSTSPARASWETSYQNYNIYKTILGQETNSAWLCSWDDDKVALPYNHALWLNLVSLGSLYSIMPTADYNPFDETLSFSIGQ